MENENVPTTPTTVEVVPQKNNKKQIVLIASISVLVIAVIIVAAYFMLLGDNKKVFTNALDKTYKEVSNTINKLDDTPIKKDIFEKPVSIAANVKANSNIEGLSLLNNYNFDLNIGMDYANKLLTLGAKVNNNSNKEIVSANLNYVNNGIYLEAPKLLNKVILLEDDLDSTCLFNVDTSALDKLNLDYINDMETIVKIMKDSLANYVTNEDITTSKETISINNKNHNVTTYKVVLEGEKLENLLNNLQKNLTNDKDLMNDYASLLDVDVEDVKDAILDNPLLLDKLEIEVYREGMLDKYVGGKIIIDDEELEVLNTDDYSLIKLGSDLTITRDKNVYTVDLSNLDSGIDNLVFKEVDDKNTEITVNMTDYDPIVLTVLEKNDNNVVLTLKYGDTSFTLDLTITYDVKLPTINTSKAVSIDDLTEEDQTTLSNNLFDIISEISELSELFEM